MGSGDGSSEPSRAADQVGLARDWLRTHGVEVPSPAPLPGRGGGADEAQVEVEVEIEGRERESRPQVEGRGRRRTARVDGDADGAGTPTARPGGRGGRTRDADGRRSATGPGGGLDPDADPEEVARTVVLRKLAAHARTREELARALRTKEVPEEAASAVLDRMTEVGLVDDATFAHDWVASRQQRRHLSRTALRRELQTKGVERDLIDDALAVVDVDDEHRAALDLARRRASSMVGLEREVAYRRLGGVLARRGFSSSVSAQVLAEVLDELRERAREG